MYSDENSGENLFNLFEKMLKEKNQDQLDYLIELFAKSASDFVRQGGDLNKLYGDDGRTILITIVDLIDVVGEKILNSTVGILLNYGVNPNANNVNIKYYNISLIVYSIIKETPSSEVEKLQKLFDKYKVEKSPMEIKIENFKKALEKKNIEEMKKNIDALGDTKKDMYFNTLCDFIRSISKKDENDKFELIKEAIDKEIIKDEIIFFLLNICHDRVELAEYIQPVLIEYANKFPKVIDIKLALESYCPSLAIALLKKRQYTENDLNKLAFVAVDTTDEYGRFNYSFIEHLIKNKKLTPSIINENGQSLVEYVVMKQKGTILAYFFENDLVKLEEVGKILNWAVKSGKQSIIDFIIEFLDGEIKFLDGERIDINDIVMLMQKASKYCNVTNHKDKLIKENLEKGNVDYFIRCKRVGNSEFDDEKITNFNVGCPQHQLPPILNQETKQIFNKNSNDLLRKQNVGQNNKIPDNFVTPQIININTTKLPTLKNNPNDNKRKIFSRNYNFGEQIKKIPTPTLNVNTNSQENDADKVQYNRNKSKLRNVNLVFSNIKQTYTRGSNLNSNVLTVNKTVPGTTNKRRHFVSSAANKRKILEGSKPSICFTTDKVPSFFNDF